MTSTDTVSGDVDLAAGPIALGAVLDAYARTDPAAGRLLDVEPCQVCEHYLARRIRVLAPQVCLLADRHHLAPPVLLDRYLTAVHARHLAGESLSTRPITGRVVAGEGVTVAQQRACNGCDRALGDMRVGELNALQAGDSLPDVTLECGCNSLEAA